MPSMIEVCRGPAVSATDFPDLTVIVGARDRVRTVPIADLLPESYVWADHQLDAE